METHKLSKEVVHTGNEIGQCLNIGGFACFSHKPKKNKAFCLNSDCARKFRTPNSCSDLKFFKLFFTLCIIVENSKKENPWKRLVAAPSGDRPWPYKQTSTEHKTKLWPSDMEEGRRNTNGSAQFCQAPHKEI